MLQNIITDLLICFPPTNNPKYESGADGLLIHHYEEITRTAICKLFMLRPLGLAADAPLVNRAQYQPVEPSIHPP